MVILFSEVSANLSSATKDSKVTSLLTSSLRLSIRYLSVVGDNMVILVGPASFSAKQPRMAHRFRSRRGDTLRVLDAIMFDTSWIDSLLGRGLSSSNNAMTLVPMGCSTGTTRISDLTNSIQPVGLSVIVCSSCME